MKRIQHLEDTIRNQEEMVMELQEKIDNIDTIEIAEEELERHFNMNKSQNNHHNNDNDGDSG